MYQLLTTEFAKKIAVLKKYRKFGIYGILEQDPNIQIFETINPSILFMCRVVILSQNTDSMQNIRYFIRVVEKFHSGV
ncbi:hypothetical protein [Leptospira kirschneri]|uniref:hypothetical protein n=1 Tax=Leptospira kirschneri TaxID=29507 RepID=UPI00046C5173|nr:hypothetical protein [Leptospira kirschneri]